MRALWGLALIATQGAAQGLTTRLEAQGWWQRQSAATAGAYAPAASRTESTALELRPDVQYDAGPWRLSAKPRLAVDATPQREAWLNEGGLRWQRGHWNLEGGRAVLLWGPSQLWSPSAPLWRSNGRNAPQRELYGHTLWRAEYAPSNAAFWQVIRQSDTGHERDARVRAGVWLLRHERIGAEQSGGVVLSRRDGEHWRVGAYGQATLNDGLLLYADGAVTRREGMMLADETPVGWRPAPEPSADYRLNALFGGAYTWENGLTLNAEVFWQGTGLSAAEAQQQQAAVEATPWPARAALFDTGSTPLRRRYLALQFRDSAAENYGWTVRLTENLDDGSGELVLQLSRDLSDRWQVWGNVLAQHGGGDREYGRYLRGMIWCGVTAYVW